MEEVTVFAGLITAPIDNLIPIGIFIGIALLAEVQIIIEIISKLIKEGN